jgi:N-methylhydantoinase A/oxoprolinase/acetone carboxylase beta subunit
MCRGARTVLIVTEGFCDALAIGKQMWPDLCALRQNKPVTVAPRSRSIEVRERMGSFGTSVTVLTDEEIARVCTAVAVLEPEAVAV